jgi:phosphohistidine phosphatase SixA
MTTTQLYLIRHANAGSRLAGGRDRYRPLSPDGRARAETLAGLLAGRGVDRLLTSPATRCHQTLAPLSAATGLALEECQALWEGSDTVATLAHLEGLEARSIVACSHGDIIPAIVEQLAARQLPVAGRGCELGSIWILQRHPEGGQVLSARYAGPRATTLDRPTTRERG